MNTASNDWTSRFVEASQDDEESCRGLDDALTRNEVYDSVARYALKEIATAVLARDLADDFAGEVWCVGSPIENAMYWALLIESFKAYDTVIARGRECSTGGDEGKPDTIWIEQQAQLGDYRVDFKLIVRARWDFNEYADAETVVECDGHDFHERTKEQAASDKARDRALQALGMRVLRFTGSEIWSDPLVCAREALAVTYRAAHEVAMDRIAGSAGR